MGKIVLVRHGQASFGADDYDVLSDLGHRQARWLGEYFAAHDLRFDRVMRGSLRRHRETAEGIASVHQLNWEAGRLRLALFNASPHLDPKERHHARTYI